MHFPFKDVCDSLKYVPWNTSHVRQHNDPSKISISYSLDPVKMLIYIERVVIIADGIKVANQLT